MRHIRSDNIKSTSINDQGVSSGLLQVDRQTVKTSNQAFAGHSLPHRPDLPLTATITELSDDEAQNSGRTKQSSHALQRYRPQERTVSVVKPHRKDGSIPFVLTPQTSFSSMANARPSLERKLTNMPIPSLPQGLLSHPPAETRLLSKSSKRASDNARQDVRPSKRPQVHFKPEIASTTPNVKVPRDSKKPPTSLLPDSDDEIPEQLDEIFRDGLQDNEQDIDITEAMSGLGLSSLEDKLPGTNIVLLKHQVIGVHWMLQQERKRFCQGGILGDDMGLGKTVEAIATMLLNPPKSEENRTTLVVLPLTVMPQWQQEFFRFTRYRCFIYHGPQRAMNADMLDMSDVVLTTYDSVTAEGLALLPVEDIGVQRGRVEIGPLFKRKWYRIVLDEAAYIRNRDSKRSQCVQNLEGDIRWSLTATPIVNGLLDAYPLLRFVGVVDWDTFDRRIYKLVRKKDADEQDQLLAESRTQAYLRLVSIRRKKVNERTGEVIVKLPPMTVEVILLEMDQDERSFYDSIEHPSRAIVNRWYDEGKMHIHRNAVFAMLMRIRQACCHPTLVKLQDVPEDLTAGTPLTEATDMAQTEMTPEPIISTSDFLDPAFLESLNAAYDGWDQAKGISKCENMLPASKEINYDLATVPLNNKLDRMCKILQAWRRDDPKQKTLIFSYFRGMLSLAHVALKRRNFKAVQFTGSTGLMERTKILKSFSSAEADSPTVMLISISAGGVGLNLSAASRVLSLDHAWNYATEEQSFGRAHRIGQKLEVTVKRLAYTNTVEERILKLQEKKKKIAEGALGEGDGTRLQRLSAEDLVSLFGGR